MKLIHFKQKILLLTKQAIVICKLLLCVGFHFLFVQTLLSFLWLVLNCGTCRDLLMEEVCEANYLSKYIEDTLNQLD